MKIRITILTENDIDTDTFCKENNISKEDIVSVARVGWLAHVKMLEDENESGNNDTCTLEKVELLED